MKLDNLQSDINEIDKKRMRVLLVEDSKLLRDTIIESLSEYENIFVEDFAISSDEAIVLLAAKKYDMLIADIELAKGNGFDVIKFNQQHQSNLNLSPTVYVVLTNHANSYYRKTAKELGVNYFFDKSMDFEQAIESICKEASLFK
jgi:DNA-binding NarL/FixJ family response regulator